jgi:hypothetical protein
MKQGDKNVCNQGIMRRYNKKCFSNLFLGQEVLEKFLAIKWQGANIHTYRPHNIREDIKITKHAHNFNCED